MYLVEFEFFTEAGLSKVANNGDSYPKDMLVAHLSILDASTKVFKASHMCTSYENYEGDFFFDNVTHPFYLDISKDSAFAFSMDEPSSLVVLPNVLSLIAPSSSGTVSSLTQINATIEYFDNVQDSKYNKTLTSVAKDSLVIHFEVRDSNANILGLVSHTVPNFSGAGSSFDSSFKFDNVEYGFFLSIASQTLDFACTHLYSVTSDPLFLSTFLSGGASGGSVGSLTPILGKIDNLYKDILFELNNNASNSLGWYNSIVQHFGQLESKVDLSRLKTFDFLDLDGNCGTFSNGTDVKVVGKDGVFKVVNSTIFWEETDGHKSMILYRLEQGGKFMSAPDILVSLVNKVA